MTNAARLFNASCMALIVTAMVFAIRGGIMSQLGRDFDLSGTQLGIVAGMAFWGFTLAMVGGGPLCDVLGMGRLLQAAFLGHLAGVVLTIAATGFWSLFFSTLLVGVANGLVEAASNPLVATLYPKDKTEKLNHFHAWFPGGIVIGGLVVYGLQRAGLGWQWQMATLLLPTFLYGAMFRGQAFPPTERVASGVSTKAMFAECLRPLFLFMIACMFLTAATENGTNQWISMLLEHAGIPGILVLVFVTGLMTVGRLFAGPVVHKLSVTGLLLVSAVLAAAGLYWMSLASGLVSLAAAAMYAVGICYFWPTMLGFVSERLPRTGALGLALMGGAGMISTAITVPIIGRMYDNNMAAALPAGVSPAVLKAAPAGSAEAAQLAAAQLASGTASLRALVIIPLLLVAAFALLAIQQRGKAAKRGSTVKVQSSSS